jgi:hypothetical protein
MRASPAAAQWHLGGARIAVGRRPDPRLRVSGRGIRATTRSGPELLSGWAGAVRPISLPWFPGRRGE